MAERMGRLLRRASERDRDRLVDVYVVGDRIILNALTPMGAGDSAWGATDAFVVLARDATTEEVGEALLTMFAASRTEPRSPGGASERTLQRHAGVRSFAALLRTASYVSVRQWVDGSTVFRPGRPDPGDGGWVTVGLDEGRVAPRPDPGPLGATLLAVVDDSSTTPWPDPTSS
jgi:hypothetical protein